MADDPWHVVKNEISTTLAEVERLHAAASGLSGPAARPHLDDCTVKEQRELAQSVSCCGFAVIEAYTWAARPSYRTTDSYATLVRAHECIVVMALLILTYNRARRVQGRRAPQGGCCHHPCVT